MKGREVASLKRRLAQLEVLRPSDPPPANLEQCIETLTLLRACVARYGMGWVVADIAPAFALGLGMQVEEAAEMLSEGLSDVVYVGDQAEKAGA
jgi:hypothetical protein